MYSNRRFILVLALLLVILPHDTHMRSSVCRHMLSDGASVRDVDDLWSYRTGGITSKIITRIITLGPSLLVFPTSAI